MAETLDDHASREPEDGAVARARFAERYRVVRQIGAGAMGDVYEAEQLGLSRRVAIKVLRRTWSGDPVSRERFRREALAACAVRHPAVVEVYAVDSDDDGVPCIVSELLDGEDLRARLDRAGRLPLAEALGVMAPLLDALDAAHAAGVVHRDLKPENVFLARQRDGSVAPRLIDFGVARLREAGPAGLTEAGDALGTPGYMAPEQARGLTDVDGRADLWSAAVLLVEMLTGALPFRAANRNALLFEAAEGGARLDDEALPAALRPILARALARDRTLRPATARAFLNELLEGAPWSDAPWCRALRSMWHTAPRPAVHPWRRRALGVAAALALGLAAALAWRDPTASAPSPRIVAPARLAAVAPSPPRVDRPAVAPVVAAPARAPSVMPPRRVSRAASPPPIAPPPPPAAARDDSLYTPFRSARPDHDLSR